MKPASNFFYLKLVSFMNDSLGLKRLKSPDFFHEKFTPKSNPPTLLPENAFIFLCHEGYQIRFFCCNGQDNPATFFAEYNPNGIHFEEHSDFEALILKYVETFIERHLKLLSKYKGNLPRFIEFKHKWNSVVSALNIITKHSNEIDNLARALRVYQCTDIYDIFRNEYLHLGAYSGLKTQNKELQPLIDEFTVLAKEVEQFYQTHLMD